MEGSEDPVGSNVSLDSNVPGDPRKSTASSRQRFVSMARPGPASFLHQPGAGSRALAQT